MPRIAYVDKEFRESTLAVIHQANVIIGEYQAQGFSLTLRQIYYQFVARDLIPNNQRSYKRLGSIINDGRLAGWIDWDAIEDRTRRLESLSWWGSPASVLRASADSFRRDRWASQPWRVEVWIEKEALAGVFEPICEELEVPFFCCRGYPSQSEVWGAAQRHHEYMDAGQEVLVLHFGDHDPSGIDMSRDIEDRLELFQASISLDRMALNMDQVEEYGPPPNPAKLTDSRASGYVQSYGLNSWELDALEPRVLAGLVREGVMGVLDTDAWETALEKDDFDVDTLRWVAQNWRAVTDLKGE